MAIYSDRFVYDDRRRLSGDPLDNTVALRAVAEHILEQYPHVEFRTLAVRGERLELDWSRWWDDAGNESTYLDLFEVDDDGLVAYEGRFDGDDFASAYRELEHRYYAGEGAAFALNGHAMADFVEAMQGLDIDAARRLSLPEFRWLAPPSALTLEDRSLDDVFRWLEERAHQVSSVQQLVECWPLAFADLRDRSR